MGLVLLQRELFPASLVSDLTGVGSDPMARTAGMAAWRCWMLTELVPSHGRRRGRDLPAGYVASRRRHLLHGIVSRIARSFRRRPRLLRRAGNRPRSESARRAKWRSGRRWTILISRLSRCELKRGFSLPMGPWLTGPAGAAGHGGQRTQCPGVGGGGQGQGCASRAGVRAPAPPLGGNVGSDGLECLAGDVRGEPGMTG